MAFIIITILVQLAIDLAVLHAFKVRKQKNITWMSPARKWYFVASAAAQAALAVISFAKPDDSSFWLLTIIVSALAAINLCTQLTIGKAK